MFYFKLVTIIILINYIQNGKCTGNPKYATYDFNVSKTIVNPHDFKYILNPGKDICGKDNGKSVLLLIYVHTSPENFNQRQTIRETWGKRSMFPNNRILFTMGATPKQEVNKLLALEFNYYNDIIQEDFTDSYKNLTYKGIMSMKWISEYCLNASFVLKTDDDIIVDMFKLTNHLVAISKYSKPKKMVYCVFYSRMPVMRTLKSKWYMTKDEYQFDYFPDYCSGSAFFFTTDLAPHLYNISHYIKFVWVDDYYLTGPLIRAVNGTYTSISRNTYSLNANLVDNKFLSYKSSQFMLFGHFSRSKTMDRMVRIWKHIVNYHKVHHNYIKVNGSDNEYFNSFEFRWGSQV